MYIRSHILQGVLFILFLLPYIKGNAQDPDPTPSWIRDIKGGSEWPFYLDVDEYDNTYLIGRYYQDFTFQGNHYAPEFQGNTFLVKISPAGEPLWYKS